jgi:Tfp pilus assembly protein PilF
MALTPGWDESALRRSLRASDTPGNAFTAALWQLVAGDVAGARQTWEAYSGHTTEYPNFLILSALLAQATGDSAAARTGYAAAKRLIYTPSDSAWVHLASGLIGEADFDQAVAAAKNALEIAPTGNDWALGANIDYIQYLELALPRKFLPQVNYSEVDLALARLLGDADALHRLRAALHP